MSLKYYFDFTEKSLTWSSTFINNKWNNIDLPSKLFMYSDQRYVFIIPAVSLHAADFSLRLPNIKQNLTNKEKVTEWQIYYLLSPV